MRSNRCRLVIKPVSIHASPSPDLPPPTGEPCNQFFAPTLPGTQPGCSRHRAEGEEGREDGEEERDVHALTYVLSIEIALTVTVFCREGSREKRG